METDQIVKRNTSTHGIQNKSPMFISDPKSIHKNKSYNSLFNTYHNNKMKYFLLLVFVIAVYLLYFNPNDNFYVNTNSNNYLRSFGLTNIVRVNKGCEEVLFLVRTYPGHFDLDKPFNILKMVRSLQALENTNWIAYLLNTDVNPLPLSGHIISNIMEKDNRIRIINIAVDHPYEKWTAGYDTTDKALDILRDFDVPWIVITNGDNIYSKRFLNDIPSPFYYDVVITNYWSRYGRPSLNGYPEVNPINMSATVCHRAFFQVGYIDLGGAILSLPRLQREYHRFMKFGAINSQDGYLFMQLIAQGWIVKHVDECLYAHAPNPYTCSALGGVWWNSPNSLSDLGDSCMNGQLAKQHLTVSLPKPVLEISLTGIQIMTLPEPYHSQHQANIMKEQMEFGRETMERRKEHRKTVCRELQKTLWKPNIKDYASYNGDLKVAGLISESDLLNHFWNNGCPEMRRISDPPPEYFAISSRPVKFISK